MTHSLLLLCVAAGILLLGKWAIGSSWLQTRLAHSAKIFVQQTLKIRIDVGKMDIGLPNWLILQNVTVYDRGQEKMLQADEIRVEIVNFSLLRYWNRTDTTQYFKVGNVALVKPNIFIYRSECDSMWNIKKIFSSGKKTKPVTPTKDKPFPLDIFLRRIAIRDGEFHFVDSLSKVAHLDRKPRLNYKHIHIKDLQLLAKVSAKYEGIHEIDVRRLAFEEIESGMKIDALSAQIYHESREENDDKNCRIIRALRLDNLDLLAGKTHIRADVHFPNQDFAMATSENMRYKVAFQKSTFDFSILDHVIPQIPPRGVVTLIGNAEGDLSHVRMPDARAWYGNDIFIDGDIHVSNFLGRVRELDLDVKVRQGTVSAMELQRLLPDQGLPKFLNNIGKANFDGLFKGSPFDFRAAGTILSQLGEAKADLHLQIPPEVDDFMYEGYVETHNFDLDKLGITSTQLSRSITVAGNIKGKGFDLKTMNTQMDAEMYHTEFMGFKMDTVKVDALFTDHKIKGKTYLNDGVGHANMTLDVDLTQDLPVIIAKGDVFEIDLQKYKVLPDTAVFFSSFVDVNIQGDDVDNVLGTAILKGANLHYAKDTARLRASDVLLNVTENTLSRKNINLKSSLLNADIEGDFALMEGVDLLQQLVKEVQLFFTNDKKVIDDYYKNKPAKARDITGKIKAQTGKELNAAFEYFKLPVFAADSTLIDADFGFANTDKVNIYLKTDSARYDKSSLKKGDFTLNFNKYPDKNNLLVHADANADTLYATPEFVLENNTVEVNWFDNNIELDVFTEQKKAGNKLHLISASYFFLDGRVISNINPASKIKTREYNWAIGDTNLIIYKKGVFDIQRLTVFTEEFEQNIRITGKLSENPADKLLVAFNGVGIDLVNKLYPVGYDLKGSLTSNIYVQDVFHDLVISGSGSLNKFGINEYTYGDIHLQSDWDMKNSRVKLGAQLVNMDKGETYLDLSGAYSYKQKENPLNFVLSTETDLPLNYITPFVESQVYDIKGNVKLQSFTITGSFSEPVIQGTGTFTKAGMGISYLKTYYTFDGDVKFNARSIYVNHLRLYDKNRHTADFYGYVYHRGLKDFNFDLQLEKIDNFLVLDTKKGDNSAFYGTIYVKDGLCAIAGDLEKIEIIADAITGSGSELFVPLSDEASFDRPEYISFKGDTIRKRGATGLQGFELNLRVRATEEAKIELIFDEKLGDIISGRGNGTLTLLINQQGDFLMNGIYEIVEGDYLFTAQNVVNKKFHVKPGGKIVWDGSPYDAQLSMDAYYRVNADYSALFDSRGTIPTDVVMNLQGNLMQPDIQLSLDIPNVSQNVVSELQNYINSVKNDPQELNKQVFSLLVFNRIAPSGLASDAGDALGQLATTSISELITNQFNYWLSKSNNNRNVNVSVGSNNFQDLTLKVQASLFNDRVTIERDGAVVGSNSNLTVGNVNVVIRLQSDSVRKANPNAGELVMEVFNRNASSTQLTQSNQIGAGIFFKRDFDKLSDLFKRQNKNKARRKPRADVWRRRVVCEG